MSKHKNKYRVGIIGCGRQASLFDDDPLSKHPCSHAGAYTAFSQKTEIVAACDIREDRLERFSKKWGVKSLYKDYKKMLKNENLDIVSICTHTPLHHEMTLAAAKSGVSAIYCEKPMASTLKEAEEMIEACKKNKVILVIGHTRRWDPTFRKVKEIIENKEIGEVKTLTSYCTAGLLNGASHLFDVLRFFNGEVDWVFANLKKDKSTEPGGTGLLKFKNGAYGFVDSDFNKYVLFEITVTGTKGMLRGGGMIRGGKSFELKEAKPSTSESGLFELFPVEFPEVGKEMPLFLAVKDIVECIETGKKPFSTGEDGKAALEIALAFHESNRSKKAVKLPIKDKKLRVVPRETSFTVDGKLPKN